MAPLHHHFEKKGWYESQVVTRFYILCILCAVVALSTRSGLNQPYEIGRIGLRATRVGAALAPRDPQVLPLASPSSRNPF